MAGADNAESGRGSACSQACAATPCPPNMVGRTIPEPLPARFYGAYLMAQDPAKMHVPERMSWVPYALLRPGTIFRISRTSGWTTATQRKSQMRDRCFEDGLPGGWIRRGSPYALPIPEAPEYKIHFEVLQPRNDNTPHAQAEFFRQECWLVPKWYPDNTPGRGPLPATCVVHYLQKSATADPRCMPPHATVYMLPLASPMPSTVVVGKAARAASPVKASPVTPSKAGSKRKSPAKARESAPPRDQGGAIGAYSSSATQPAAATVLSTVATRCEPASVEPMASNASDPDVTELSSLPLTISSPAAVQHGRAADMLVPMTSHDFDLVGVWLHQTVGDDVGLLTAVGAEEVIEETVSESEQAVLVEAVEVVAVDVRTVKTEATVMN